MNLETYCIEKGEKDYSPSDGFEVGKLKPGKYLVYEFILSEDVPDYIDPVTGKLDQDWHDWKKGGGLSLAKFGVSLVNLIKLDRDNIMWVWRWNPVKEIYELSGYSNSKGKKRVGDVQGEVIMELEPGQRGWCCIFQEADTSTIWLSKGSFPGTPVGGEPALFKQRKKFSCYRIIGVYYGGKNNAEGIWGGRAPIDHCHRIGKHWINI